MYDIDNDRNWNGNDSYTYDVRAGAIYSPRTWRRRAHCSETICQTAHFYGILKFNFICDKIECLICSNVRLFFKHLQELSHTWFWNVHSTTQLEVSRLGWNISYVKWLKSLCCYLNSLINRKFCEWWADHFAYMYLSNISPCEWSDSAGITLSPLHTYTRKLNSHSRNDKCKVTKCYFLN